MNGDETDLELPGEPAADDGLAFGEAEAFLSPEPEEIQEPTEPEELPEPTEPGGPAEEASEDTDPDGIPVVGDLVEEPAPELEEEPRAAPGPRGIAAWYSGLPRAGRVAVWVVFVVWAALGLLFLRDLGTRDRSPDSRAGTPSRARDLLLLAMRNEGDVPPSFLLVHHGYSRSSVVTVAPGVLIEVPGVGPVPLSDALNAHGAEAASVAVGNAMRIHVPDWLVADPQDVRTLVTAVGGVEVDIPETVEIEQDGVLRRLYDAGPKRMDPDALIAFLALRVPQEQELERLSRIDAAWRGLFAAMRDTPPAAVATALRGWDGATDRSAAEVLVGAAAAPNVSFMSVPLERSQVPEVSLYEIKRDELGTIQTALHEVQAVQDPRGRRVRLLRAADGVDVVPVAKQLVEAGYVIVLTGAAPQQVDETRIVMAENTEELRETARALQELLGAGKLGVFSESQTVFDVTLLVGRDLPLANPDATP
jgi:hypothetical protein